MTADELIAEGRRLMRPSVFLRPTGNGPISAIWLPWNAEEWRRTKQRCWITVDTSFIPGWPNNGKGLISVFTKGSDDGCLIFQDEWPSRPGTKLFASEESVLPPLDAVFLLGSELVAKWLASNGWERNIRYNNNFKDRTIAEAYLRIWFDEYPLYREDDVYAALGGWHWPCADDDWYDLVDKQLLVLTSKDAEPWVEAWRLGTGENKVIQRIT